MNHSFSVLFWLLNNRISKKTGEAPIMVRITVDGKRAEISSGKKLLPEKWNVNSGKMKGNSEEARIFNRRLAEIKLKIERIYDDLEKNGQFISAQVLKSLYNGEGTKQHSLLELFRYHNNQIKSQIGNGYAERTLKRYETTLNHTEKFLSHKYRRNDINLNELKYEFITEFEFYLKSEKKISHNTTMKYLRYFKKIVLIAVKNDWIQSDPFARYEMHYNEVKKGYLTKEELQRLYNKDIQVERLDHVRDVFLFCCYTGLSYVDVKKLTSDNISKGLDGEYWIFVDRTKTGASSNVPLLPIAKVIIEKYSHYSEISADGSLLPVYTNQNMNAYLKELATICEINKKITFHMARHTFATTVTLSNGVAIETVGSMLGHKNLKTTQIYAKVVQEKVSQDMKKLKETLAGSDFMKASNQ